MPDFPDQWGAKPRAPFKRRRALPRRTPTIDVTGGVTMRPDGVASTARVGFPTLLGPEASSSGAVIGGPPRYTLFIDSVRRA